MNVEAILKSLREERESLNEAILSLQRLGTGMGKRRGRPPAWMKQVQEAKTAAGPKRRGRPPGSKNKVS
jgi:hypothetical protein